MAAEPTRSWQRTAAVYAAVALLLLSLVYRFLPGWLFLSPADLPRSVARADRSLALDNAAVGAASMPANAGTSIYTAGPPVALASFAAHAVPAVALQGPAPVLALLRQAQAAENADHWAGTPDSAAALYQKVLAMDPGNASARAGLTALNQRLAASAAQSIAAGDARTAQALITLLSAQPGGLQLATPLQARLFVLQHVQPLLRQAAQYRARGQLQAPSGANALDSYRRVLALDPGNAVARRGIADLQQGMLQQFQTALAADAYGRAQQWLAEAAAIASDTQQLQAARAQLQAARTRRADALATRALAALNARAPELAQQLAAQARTLQPQLPLLRQYQARARDFALYDGYRPGGLFADAFVDRDDYGPTMVVIPAGSFEMGARPGQPGFRSDQAPQHRVTFARGFALSRSEITVAQFRAFVRATGYVSTEQRASGALIYDVQNGRMRMDAQADWRDGYDGQPAAGDMPVINVSWADAEAYCDWLSRMTGHDYQLPSEAQYEYAERAGTSTPYWWGSGSPRQKVENLAGALDRSPTGRHWDNAFPGYGDGYWGPAPVMSFLPDPFGLYDMDGNVSEWTEDCWHDNYIRAPDNGSAWINPGCTHRVVRGASWASTPDQALSAWRMDTLASLGSARIGFRVMRRL